MSIGATFGGKVIRAPEPVHGKAVHIQHGNTGVFTRLRRGFQAARHRSLTVEASSLSEELKATAWNPEGLIMRCVTARGPWWASSSTQRAFSPLRG